MLVITAHPSLEPLAGALAAAGLRPYCTQSREIIAHYLATTGGRCAAVLDASRPAPYSFAALYHLLHQPPAVPTLLVLPPEGAPPLGPGGLAPLDDFVRLPAQPAELALRVQALLLRAGLNAPDGAAAPAPVPPVTPAPPPAAPPGLITTTEGGESPLQHTGPRLGHEEQLVPGIRLYTDSHLVIGQVDPGRRRLSDHLNDAQRAYLDVTQGYCYDLLAEAGPPTGAGIMGLRKDSLQVVVPEQETGPRSAARVRTQPVPIVLALSLFVVTGHLTRRAGDSTHLLQWFTESGRSFLPVVNATIRYLPNSRFDAQVPVALVSIRQVQIWWSPTGPAAE